MTCTTCHDVHREQRDVAELSVRCGICHGPKTCPELAGSGATARANCVDCHMPLMPSRLVEVQRYRTHRIAVYAGR
jgi:hypothetical protein